MSVLAAVLFPIMSTAMMAQNTPTNSVRSAFDALAGRDWSTLAGLIDSKALESLRQDALGMLILTTEQRLAGEKPEGGYNPKDVVIADHLRRVGGQRIPGFRGAPTIEELASLSHRDFFVEWARAAYGDEPPQDPVQDVAGLYRRIIGEIIADQETAYVVYRREHRYLEGELKTVLPGRVVVIPVVRTEGNWRLRFNDDIGWTIDFSHVVFYEREQRAADRRGRAGQNPADQRAMPERVIPPEPLAPRQERTSARPTPTQVVESAFVAFKEGDWPTLSDLVDPTVLGSFQQHQLSYFVALIQSREARAQSKREGMMAFMLSYDDSLSSEAITQVAELQVPLLPSPRSIGELARLAPGEFFDVWCRAAYGQGKGIGGEKRSFERRIVGHVFEGEDRGYVLYHSEYRYSPQLMPLSWSYNGWRIGLNADIGWQIDLNLEADDP